MSLEERLSKINLGVTPLDSIDEDTIKKIVREMAFPPIKSWTEGEILAEIISITKCTLTQAKKIFSVMMELGLEVCTCLIFKEFFVSHFALMRGFVTAEEIQNYHEQLIKEYEEAEKEESSQKSPQTSAPSNIAQSDV